LNERESWATSEIIKIACERGTGDIGVKFPEFKFPEFRDLLLRVAAKAARYRASGWESGCRRSAGEWLTAFGSK